MEQNGELPSEEALYGDDFSQDEIARWYAEEESAYVDLRSGKNGYEYHSLNRHFGYAWLPEQRFDVCLAFGCAKGDDVHPIADRIGRFIAIEPAECWWRDEIGGIPATYLKPTIMGEIPLLDASVDLVTCLGVLHHIPNVSYVLSELVRSMKPGAYMILREPICSMGDWRKPRPGLTKNERGLPLPWLREQLARNGLRIVREAPCQVGPLARAMVVIAPSLMDSPFYVAVDAVVSRLLGYGRYYRSTTREKFAAASGFFLLQKQ